MNHINKFKYSLTKLILPTNYPKSVNKGYLDFITKMGIISTCNSISTTLATQTAISTLSTVSNTSSIAYSISINFVLKDCIGQTIGVSAGSRLSSLTDKNPVLTLVSATIVCNLATSLELITPFYPELFLPLSSLSMIVKNACWILISGSRARLNEYYAIDKNLGDITSKSAVQTSYASSIGIIIVALSSNIIDTYGLGCVYGIYGFTTAVEGIVLYKLLKNKSTLK